MATFGNKASTLTEALAAGWVKGRGIPWDGKAAYRVYLPEAGQFKKIGMMLWGSKYTRSQGGFGTIKLFVYRDQGGVPGPLFLQGSSLSSSFLDYPGTWYDFDLSTEAQKNSPTAAWFWLGVKLMESSYKIPADQEIYLGERYNPNTDRVWGVDTKAYPNVEDPFGPFDGADHNELLLNVTYTPTEHRIYSIDPVTGPNCGNQYVKVTGDNLYKTPTVRILGQAGLSPYRPTGSGADDTKIYFYTPARPDLLVPTTGDVEVTIDGITKVLPNAYTYTPLRFDWDTVEPQKALITGGTVLTLKGYGFNWLLDPAFASTAQVKVGGYTAQFTVVDDNTLTLIVPDVTVNPDNDPRWYNIFVSIGTLSKDQEFRNKLNQVYLDYGQGFIWLQHADGFVQYPPIPVFQTAPNKAVLAKPPARPLVTGFDRCGTTRFILTRTETPPKSPALPFMLVDREYVRPMVSKIKAVNYDPEYYGGDGAGGGGGPGEDEWPWGDPNPSGKLDVVICLDTTGSMSGRAGGVIQSVRSWLNVLASRTLDIKVGVVTFGDAYNCGPMLGFDNILDNPLEELGYARPVFGWGSPGAASAFLGGVPVGGGEDSPENPLGALNFALDHFLWRWDSSKVALVVTDNPAHHPGDPTINLVGEAFQDSYYASIGAGESPHQISAWPGTWYPPTPGNLIARLQEGRVLTHTFNMPGGSDFYPVEGLSTALGGVHIDMPNNGVADLSSLPLPGVAF